MASYAGIVAFTVINYICCLKLVQFNPEWEAMITQKCGEEDWTVFFLEHSVVKTSTVNGVFGAYFGMHLQSRYLDGLSHCKDPKSVWPLKYLGRMIVMLCIGLPFYYMDEIDVGEDANWGYKTLKWLIPYFCMYFFMFSIVDWICLRIRLYDQRRQDDTKTSLIYTAANPSADTSGTPSYSEDGPNRLA